MWEAVANPGQSGTVVAWARAWETEGLEAKEVYAAGERIVLVAHFTDPASAERAMAEPATLHPPTGALARDGIAWTFERVG